MNKWSRIKDKIYEEKLNEISDRFAEVYSNVNDVNIPRGKWVAPLENWTKNQIKEDGSLKLSLQEYSYFKNLLENLNQDFVLRDDKNKVIAEFK